MQKACKCSLPGRSKQPGESATLSHTHSPQPASGGSPLPIRICFPSPQLSLASPHTRLPGPEAKGVSTAQNDHTHPVSNGFYGTFGHSVQVFYLRRVISMQIANMIRLKAQQTTESLLHCSSALHRHFLTIVFYTNSMWALPKLRRA